MSESTFNVGDRVRTTTGRSGTVTEVDTNGPHDVRVKFDGGHFADWCRVDLQPEPRHHRPEIPEAAIEAGWRALHADTCPRGDDCRKHDFAVHEYRARVVLAAALPHLIGPFAAANTGPGAVAKAVALSDVIRAVPDEPVTRLIGLRALLAQHERLLTDEFFGPDQCSCGWAGDGFADHVASAIEATIADTSWQEVSRLKRELTRRRMSDAESAAFFRNYVPSEDLAGVRREYDSLREEVTDLLGDMEFYEWQSSCETDRQRGIALGYELATKFWASGLSIALATPHSSNTPPRVEAEDAVSAETRHGRDSARPAAVGGGE